MEIFLRREPSIRGRTFGALSIDGIFECWTIEDVVRPGDEKVPGETAIPAGRYEVRITLSQRFGRMLPILLDVPNFTGIRIHPGNTAADTEGCILPGRTKGQDAVYESRVAFTALYGKISAARDGRDAVWITITDAG